MKQVKATAVLLAGILSAAVLISGCGGTDAPPAAASSAASSSAASSAVTSSEAASSEAEPTGEAAPVDVQAGAVEDYEGVYQPTLEAKYFQSEEEAKRYDAEMQDVLTNGLDGERELQSGI